MNRRISIAVAVAAIAAAALTAGTAPAATGAVRFVAAPAVAIQGKSIRVAISFKRPFARCTLSVKFSDKTSQTVGNIFATNGQAEWHWQVPNVATPGRATLTATCTGGGIAHRAITVVGDLTPPKIAVLKQGFSIRPRPTGTNVSFGVMLKNISADADALNVYVLVNMLLADGHVLGTSASTIDAIGANGTFAYGGNINFPGGAPITELEVAIKVGGRQKRFVQQPLAENVRIVPDRYDASWVGEVDGELINDHPSLNVRSAKLSTVVFDSDGNIIGGGTGYASALLPPGTREAFVLRTGVDAIPWGRAASAKVSPLATYSS
jgi:hypothetical protein